MKFIRSLTIPVLLVAPAFVQAGALWDGVGCDGPNCSSCNVVALANNLVVWLIAIMFIIFMYMMITTGFKFVTSLGNPEAKNFAKERFINSIIGILIVLGAWIAVDTLIKVLVSDTGNVQGVFWAEVQCFDQTAVEGMNSTFDIENTQIAYGNQAGCFATDLSSTQLQSIGCTVNACADASCLTSCMNVRSFDGSNYCVSDNRAASAAIAAVGAAGTCGESTCASITIPCGQSAGSNANCTISPDMVSRLEGMHNGASVSGARVTEGYPPTRDHKSQCHYNGTCIDYSKQGGMTSTEVKSVYDAAIANGLRPVYEVSTEARRQELITAGVPADSVKNYGSWISGEHFSIYGY